MAQISCPECGFSPLVEGARFCHQCGQAVAINRKPSMTSQSRPSSLGWFVGSILLTLAISWLLSAVLHWPVFILGAFLLLVWWKRKP